MLETSAYRTTADLGALQPVSGPFSCAKIVLGYVSHGNSESDNGLAHVGNEDHAAIGDQVKERFNLSMFLEESSHIFTARFVLWSQSNVSASGVGAVLADVKLALMLRIKRVRQGRSR